MPKYLIEVPHKPDVASCVKAVRVFLETGSHFLTNAEWGCYDGEHKAWFIIETDTKDDARNVVPHTFRQDAKITQLNRFTMAEIDSIMLGHKS